VNYTGAGGHTVISMFQVTGDPDIADANSEVILLTFDQPFANNNGGQLQFGPDGMLYIASGDGGSGGDPNNNGQNRNTLLGKLLRVDVESQPGTLNFPATTPS
jgi:glucose/arabinose dehydrogenase